MRKESLGNGISIERKSEAKIKVNWDLNARKKLIKSEQVKWSMDVLLYHFLSFRKFLKHFFFQRSMRFGSTARDEHFRYHVDDEEEYFSNF